MDKVLHLRNPATEVDDGVGRLVDSREHLCGRGQDPGGVRDNDGRDSNPRGVSDDHYTAGGVVLGRLLSTLAVCAATCCNILVAS